MANKTLEDVVKENETLTKNIQRMKFEYNKQGKQLNAALDRIRNIENKVGFIERSLTQLSSSVDRLMRYFR